MDECKHEDVQEKLQGYPPYLVKICKKCSKDLTKYICAADLEKEQKCQST